MNRKIMLLVLAVASAAAFMVPATASATFEPLHMSPTPAKLDVAGFGGATLRTSSGDITCNGVNGTATPEAGGTTGTIQLTFGTFDCTGPFGATCTSTNPAHTGGSIRTTLLPYHLVTLDDVRAPATPPAPGVLVTPANGAFAHFTCHVFGIVVNVTVEGNGVLGTIAAPSCGGTSSTATMSFKALEGSAAQEHQYVEGPTSSTIWNLTRGGNLASLEMHTTFTAANSSGQVINSQLVCT